MNKLDIQYQDLVRDILKNGYSKGDRTGTGTKSVFGRQIRHKMSDGFPLLTTKKMPFKTITTELLWFLRGDTNIKYLVDNNCHVWDGDCYKNYLNVVLFEKSDYFHEKYGHLSMSMKKDGDNYLPYTQDEFIERIKINKIFGETWGELGPIYGKQWRNWNSYVIKPGLVSRPDGLYNENYLDYGQLIDQIQNSINLLKTDPDSRRNIVSAWNVGELDQMVLPPCHNFFQFYTRELSLQERVSLFNEDKKKKGIRTRIATVDVDEDYLIKCLKGKDIPVRAISLMWNQRSVDTGLGLPFNIASYGLLLEIIAKMVNMFPDELIDNLGDTHIYNNHIEPIQEQLSRESFKLPKLNISNNVIIDIKKYIDKEDMNLDMFISRLKSEDFILEDYQSHPTIKLPLSN